MNSTYDPLAEGEAVTVLPPGATVPASWETEGLNYLALNFGLHWYLGKK